MPLLSFTTEVAVWHRQRLLDAPENCPNNRHWLFRRYNNAVSAANWTVLNEYFLIVRW